MTTTLPSRPVASKGRTRVAGRPAVRYEAPTIRFAPTTVDTAILPVLEPAPVTPTSGVVAVVPAHNEEEGIADVIRDLQQQTVAPERIVVIVNNSTDRTREIAEGFAGVEVVDLPDNEHKKVGALIHAWQLVGGQQPYWLGVDADTRLDPECIEQMLAELSADEKLGGVMARYTFEQGIGRKENGLIGSLLVFAQRLEFAGWIDDLMHRGRKTYVLGGQASLFRTSVLAEIAEMDDRTSPWTTATLVEDMELSWQIEQRGYGATVSKDARAYAGPMTSLRGLWGQRSKWDYGLSKLLWDRRAIKHDPITRYPWKLQAKMLLDFTLRTLFMVQLTASLVLDAFTWFWIWIIPPIWASLLNLRLASNLPNRRFVDYLLAGTLIVPEIYLMLRLASWFRCWLKVFRGHSFDGWSAQYSAERKAALK